jgi:hypothetical protein
MSSSAWATPPPLSSYQVQHVYHSKRFQKFPKRRKMYEDLLLRIEAETVVIGNGASFSSIFLL